MANDAQPLTLLDTTSGIGADGEGSSVAGLGRYAGLSIELNASAVPSGGTPALAVYLQTTFDGTTWQDIASYAFAGTIAKRYLNISTVAAGGTATRAPSDGALTNDTVVQGPFGDRLRVKYKFTAGGSSGTYTLGVKVWPLAPGL